MSKEIKSTVIVREAIKFPINSKFPNGIYTRHPPTKCDHLLQDRPIHLKKNRAYDGKEVIQIITISLNNFFFFAFSFKLFSNTFTYNYIAANWISYIR